MPVRKALAFKGIGALWHGIHNEGKIIANHIPKRKNDAVVGFCTDLPFGFLSFTYESSGGGEMHCSCPNKMAAEQWHKILIHWLKW